LLTSWLNGHKCTKRFKLMAVAAVMVVSYLNGNEIMSKLSASSARLVCESCVVKGLLDSGTSIMFPIRHVIENEMLGFPTDC
jgi:hypothetical protein